MQVNTELKDDGARRLGDSLNINSSLLELRLVSFCQTIIVPADGRTGDQLLLMRVLQSNNRIGDVGAGGLSKGLQFNYSLQKLCLVSIFVSCSFLLS
jgi:hypothetical protein